MRQTGVGVDQLHIGHGKLGKSNIERCVHRDIELVQIAIDDDHTRRRRPMAKRDA